MVIGHQKNPSGFTLIEILLVLAIFAIIFSFTSINLLKPQQTANVNAVALTLVADIKEQQIKSMASDSGGANEMQAHGIFFENNRYTLFAGSTYNPSDPLNFVIDLNPNVIIINNLPASQIVFSENNGLWTAYNDTAKRIVVRSHNPSDPIPPPPTGPTCEDADVNGNGVINIGDIFTIAAHLPPDPYEAVYDVDKDSTVESADVFLAAGFFGQSCPPQPQTLNQKTITVNEYGGIYIN